MPQILLAKRLYIVCHEPQYPGVDDGENPEIHLETFVFRFLKPRLTGTLTRGFLGACLILAIWQSIAIVVTVSRGVAFPTPWQTLLRLCDLFGGLPLGGHCFSTHIAQSLKRWAIGIGIAATGGFAYALLAARSPLCEAATSLIPRLFLLVPGLAWIPVAILLFGIGETATIFMIAAAAFAPIAVNVLAGIKGVDVSLIRAAGMLGVGRQGLFFLVLVPAALPFCLSGLRIGLGTGWRVLVAAEMIVGTGAGLGYSIIQARWNLDYLSSFACLAVICGIGFFVESVLLGTLERRTIKRWTLSGPTA
jgi:NitT/TauT family transport system permease protein/taurine transport system permease protein